MNFGQMAWTSRPKASFAGWWPRWLMLTEPRGIQIGYQAVGGAKTTGFLRCANWVWIWKLIRAGG
jgi:hypothetical protein